MTSFAQLMDSAVLSAESASFHITDDWLQGRTVYGGLQAALAVKAMRQLADPAAPLRSVQVTFIGPVVGGEITVSMQLLRQGKSAGHVQAEIVQDGKIRLVAIGIFASDRQSEAFLDPVMPPSVSLEQAVAMPYVEGNRPPFFQHFECRNGEGAPLYSGARGEDLRSKLWARLADDPTCSEEHLTCLADLAPPVAAMQLSRPAPGSSMNWQLDFVRTPDQLRGNEWYRIDADVHAADRGYSWQDCSIWTEKGELAVLSRQCMAVFG